MEQPKKNGTIFGADDAFKTSITNTEYKKDVAGYKPYLDEIYLDQDLDEQRAQAQGRGERWLHGLARLVPDIAAEMVAGAGYLGAFVGSGGSIDSTINNGFSAMVNDWKENFDDSLPIYKTKAYQEGSFIQNLGSASFWAEDGLGLVSSVISMMVPAAAAGKLAGMTARSLGKALSTGARAAKLAKYGTGLTRLSEIGKGLQTAKWVNNISSGAAALTSRTIENAMEAKQSYDDVVSSLEGQLNPETEAVYTPEEIKERASKAAAFTFRAGYALTGLEFMQMKTLFGGMKASREAVKGLAKGMAKYGDDPIKGALKGIAGKTDDALSEATEKAVKNGFLKGKVGKVASSLYDHRKGFFNIVSEAGEENYQLAVQNLAKQRALSGDDEDAKNLFEELGGNALNVLGEMGQNFTTKEGQQAMLLGGLGGGIFGGIAHMNENKENARRIESLKNLAIQTASHISAINKQKLQAAYFGDKEQFDKLTNDSLTAIAWSMFQQGRGGELNDMVDLIARQIAEDTDSAITEIDGQEVEEGSNESVFKDIISKNLTNTKESFTGEEFANKLKAKAALLEKAYNDIQGKYEYNDAVKAEIFSQYSSQLVMEEQIDTLTENRQQTLQSIFDDINRLNPSAGGLTGKASSSFLDKEANIYSLKSQIRAKEKAIADLTYNDQSNGLDANEENIHLLKEEKAALEKELIGIVHGKDVADRKEFLRVSHTGKLDNLQQLKIDLAAHEANPLQADDVTDTLQTNIKNQAIKDKLDKDINSLLDEISTDTAEAQDLEKRFGVDSIQESKLSPRKRQELKLIDDKLAQIRSSLHESYRHYNNLTEPGKGQEYYNKYIEDTKAWDEKKKVYFAEKLEKARQNVLAKANLAMSPTTALGFIRANASMGIFVGTLTPQDIKALEDAEIADGGTGQFSVTEGLLNNIIAEYQKLNKGAGQKIDTSFIGEDGLVEEQEEEQEEISTDNNEITAKIIRQYFMALADNNTNGIINFETIRREGLKPLVGNPFKGAQFNNFVDLVKDLIIKEGLQGIKIEDLEHIKVEVKSEPNTPGGKPGKGNKDKKKTSSFTDPYSIPNEELYRLLTEAIKSGQITENEIAQTIVGIVDNFYSASPLTAPISKIGAYRHILGVEVPNDGADLATKCKEHNEGIADAAEAGTDKPNLHQDYESLQRTIRAYLVELVSPKAEEEVEEEQEEEQGEEEVATAEQKAQEVTELIKQNEQRPEPYGKGITVNTRGLGGAGVMVFNKSIDPNYAQYEVAVDEVIPYSDKYALAVIYQDEYKQGYPEYVTYFIINDAGTGIEFSAQLATRGGLDGFKTQMGRKTFDSGNALDEQEIEELYNFVVDRYNAEVARIKQAQQPKPKVPKGTKEKTPKTPTATKPTPAPKTNPTPTAKEWEVKPPNNIAKPPVGAPLDAPGKFDDARKLFSNPVRLLGVNNTTGTAETVILKVDSREVARWKAGNEVDKFGDPNEPMNMPIQVYSSDLTLIGYVPIYSNYNDAALDLVKQVKQHFIDGKGELTVPIHYKGPGNWHTVSENGRKKEANIFEDPQLQVDEKAVGTTTNPAPVVFINMGGKTDASKQLNYLRTLNPTLFEKLIDTDKNSPTFGQLKINGEVLPYPGSITESRTGMIRQGMDIRGIAYVLAKTNNGGYQWMLTDRFGKGSVTKPNKNTFTLDEIKANLQDIASKVSFGQELGESGITLNYETALRTANKPVRKPASTPTVVSALSKFVASGDENEFDPHAAALEDADEAPFKTADGQKQKMDRAKAVAYLSKILPQIPVKNLEELVTRVSLHDKWGAFKNGVIYLGNNAGWGTEYHEAFHAVFRSFLSDSEQDALYAEAKEKTGKTDPLALEEWMADEFPIWKKTRNARSLPKKILDFFKSILQYIGIMKDHSTALETVFKAIDSGRFAKAEFKKNRFTRDVSKFKEDTAFKRVGNLDSFTSSIDTWNMATIMEQRITNAYLDGKALLRKEFIEESKKEFLASQTKPSSITFYNSIDKETNRPYLDTLVDMSIKVLNDYNYGIDSQERESRDAKDLQFIKKEFDSNPYEYSGKESISVLVKRMIAFTRYEDGGAEKFVDFASAYDVLERALAGKRYHEMEDAMDELSLRNKEIAAVWSKIRRLSATDNNILNAFKVAFNRHSIISKKILITAMENGGLNQVLLVNANKENPEGLLLRRWESNFRALYENNSKANEIKDEIEKEFHAIMQEEKKAHTPPDPRRLHAPQGIDEKYAEFRASAAPRLQKLYAKIGIHLTDGLINSFITGELKNSESTFGQFLWVTKMLLDYGLSKGSIDKRSKNWNEYTYRNPFSGGGIDTSLGDLARMDLDFRDGEDVFSPNYLNIENKTVHSFTLPNSIQEILDDLVAGGQRLNLYQQDVFLGNNWLLNPNNELLLKDLEFQVLDGAVNVDTKSIGTKASDAVDKDWWITILGLYYNNRTAGTAWYPTPQPADKSIIGVVKFPRIEDLIDTETGEVGENAINKLYSIYEQERARIEKATREIENRKGETKALPDSELIQNYHYQKLDVNGKPIRYDATGKLTGNAVRYNHLHFLNDLLLDKKTGKYKKGLTKKEAVEAIVKDAIKTYLQGTIDNTIDTLHKYGIVEKTINKTTNEYEVSNKLLDGFIGEKGKLYIHIAEFVINSLIAIDTTYQLTAGDLAFTKTFDKEGKFSITDAVKRYPMTYAFGPSLISTVNQPGSNGKPGTIKSTYKLAVLDKIEVNLDPQTLKEVSHVTGVSTERADAVEFCTLDRYVEILQGLGRNNPDMKGYIEAIKRGEDVRTMSIPIGPLKGVYFGLDFANFSPKTRGKNQPNVFTGIKPTYVKSMLVPLLPSWYNKPGNEDLKALNDMLYEQGVDHAAFNSAVKIGATGINQLPSQGVKPTILSVMELQNSSWRLQQELPYKPYDTKVPLGVQITELIDGYLDEKAVFEFEGKPLSADKIREVYNSMMASIIREKKEDVMSKFLDANGERNDAEIAKALTEHFEDMGASDNKLDYLKVRVRNGKVRFEHNANLPNITKKFQEMILSYFTNRVLSHDFPGMKLSLVSDVWQKIQDPETGEYRPLRFIEPVVDANGKVLKIGMAEIKMPHFMREYFKQGDIFDPTKVPTDLLEMIGYRIPTADHNSMFHFKIVEFMDAAQGNIAVVPPQVSYTSGSDFDADALYTLRKGYYSTRKQDGTLVYSVYKYRQTIDASNWREAYADYKNYNIKENKEIRSFLKEHQAELIEYVKKHRKTQDEIYHRDYNSDEAVNNLMNAIFGEDEIIPNREEIEDFLVDNGQLAGIQAFKAMPIDKQNTLGAKMNRIIDIYKSILSNPSMHEAMTSPTTDKMFTDLTPKDKEEIKTVFGDINSQVEARRNNNTGKNLVGPAAVTNTAKAALHKAKGTINPVVKMGKNGRERTVSLAPIFDGKVYDKFYSENNRNYAGVRIATEHGGLVQIMVDNAKNPLANKLNLTLNNIGPLSKIMQVGAGIDRMILIATQPAMITLTNQLNNLQGKLSSDFRGKTVQARLIDDLLKETSRIIGKLIDSDKAFIPTDTMMDIKTANLLAVQAMVNEGKDKYEKRSLSENRLYYTTQFEVLNHYRLLMELEEHTRKTTDILRINTGIDPTVKDVLDLINTYHEAVRDEVVNAEKILITNEAKEEAVNVLFAAKKVLDNYFFETTDFYTHTVETIEGIKGDKLSQIEYKYVVASLRSFLLSKELGKIVTNGERPFSAEIGQRLLKQQINGEDNTETLKARINRMYAEPRFAHNPFIKKLTFPDKKDGIDHIWYNNLYKLTPRQEDRLKDAYLDLLTFTHKDPIVQAEVRQIAKDLVKFAFFTQGFEYAFNSLVKIIPASIMKAYSDVMYNIEDTLQGVELRHSEEGALLEGNMFGQASGDVQAEFMEAFFKSSVNTSLVRRVKTPKGKYKGNVTNVYINGKDSKIVVDPSKGTEPGIYREINKKYSFYPYIQYDGNYFVLNSELSGADFAVYTPRMKYGNSYIKEWWNRDANGRWNKTIIEDNLHITTEKESKQAKKPHQELEDGAFEDSQLYDESYSGAGSFFDDSDVSGIATNITGTDFGDGSNVDLGNVQLSGALAGLGFSGDFGLQKDSPLSPIDRNTLVSTLNKLSERFGIQWVEDNTQSTLGRYDNGIVYINSNLAKADTPFHEFIHPFINIIQKENPALFKALVQQVQGHKSYEATKAKYPELWNQEDKTDFHKEAITQAAGEYAANEADDSKGIFKFLKTLFEKIKNFFKDVLGVSKEDLTEFGPKTTLREIGKFFAKGEGKLDLSKDNTQGVFLQKPVMNSQEVENTINAVGQAVKLETAQRTYEDSTDGEVESFYKTVNGEELQRTTDFIGDYIKYPFDAEAYVKKKFPDDAEKQAKELAKYEAVTDIGTRGHATLSDIISGKPLSQINHFSPEITSAIMKQFTVFKNRYGIKGKLLTEKVVANTEHGLAGTVDVIEILPDGRVNIWDFKFSLSSTRNDSYKNGFGKVFKDPIGLEESKHNKHGLQLNTYRKILELGDESIGLNKIRVNKMGIIPVHIKIDENNNLKSTFFEEIVPIGRIKQVDKILQPADAGNYFEKLKRERERKTGTNVAQNLLDNLTLRSRRLAKDPSRYNEYVTIEENKAKLLRTMDADTTTAIAKDDIDSISEYLSLGTSIEDFEPKDLYDWINRLKLYVSIPSLREEAAELLAEVREYADLRMATDALSRLSNTEERGLHSVEDILKARPDMNAAAKMVSSFGNNSHELIQYVDKLISKAHYDKTIAITEWNNRIDEATKKLKTARKINNPEMLFKPLIQVDSKGKPTGSIVQKNTPEFWKDAYNTKNVAIADRKDWIANNKDNPKYIDSKYLEVQKSPELKAFYDIWIEFMNYAKNNLLPEEYLKPGFIPFIKSDLIEQAYKKGLFAGIISGGKELFSFIEKGGTLQSEDSSYGNISEGREAKEVPVFGTATYSKAKFNQVYSRLLAKKVDGSTKSYKDFVGDKTASKEVKDYISDAYNKAMDEAMENKSYNLEKVLKVFVAMSFNKKYMDEVAPQAELVKDYLENREVNDATGETNRNRVGFYKEQLEKELYGVAKKTEYFNFFGKKIRYDKLVDKMLNLTSVARIALNPVGGAANAVYASISNRIEAAGGEHYSATDYRAAIGKFWELAGSGELFKKNNIHSLLIDRYNITNNLSELEGGGKLATEPKIGFNTLFWMHNVGEKYMQGAVMLAMLKKKGWLNKYEVRNGKLTWKEGIEDVPSPEEESEFISRVKAVTEMLHGRYDKRSMAVAQKYAVGRIFYMFHKWVVPAFEARFMPKYYNERLGQEIEGRYHSLVELGKYLKETKSLTNAWKELSINQKANIKKAGMDALFLTGIIAAAMLLVLDDDDEDKFLKITGFKMMPNDRGLIAGVINRVLGDHMQFYNPFNMANIFLGEVALKGLFDDVSLLLTDSYDEYKVGPYKGYHKFPIRLATVLPLGSTIKLIARESK